MHKHINRLYSTKKHLKPHCEYLEHFKQVNHMPTVTLFVFGAAITVPVMPPVTYSGYAQNIQEKEQFLQ